MTNITDSMEQTDTVYRYSDFNSRTNLTEKGKLKDDYNPADHRDQAKSTSTGGALANLLKGSLGTGILAMPMVFYNGGIIFGMIGTIVAGLLCAHSVQILVSTSQDMCKKARVPALGYAETAGKVFEYGPKRLRAWSNFANNFVDYGLIVSYYAVGCVVIVFIATSFHDVLNYNHQLDIDIRIYIAITLVPCLLVGQVRTLKWLVPFSSAANVFIVITFGITLYYMFKEPLVISDKPYVAQLKQIPLFIGTVIFAMEGIGVVMPVENSMRNPHHFLSCPGILCASTLFVVTLYAIIGFFGYVRYGSEVRGSITLNLEPGEDLADAAKLLMGLAALLTFALHFYVPSEALWRKIHHKFKQENHNKAQICYRTVIILLSGGIAAAVPNLEPFISLVGAFFFSFLGIFLPSVIETVHLYPDRLGWCKWKLAKNLILCLVSIGAMFAGAWGSIEDIIAAYK